MKGHRGFTLVEMLVAISVASLLIGLVYGAVRVGQRSAAAMDRQVEQSEVMRIGWEFLHNALTRARAVANPDDDDDRSGFAGSANALSFVADMPAYVGLGGLMRIDLAVEDDRDGRLLVLSRRRFDSVEGATAADEYVERAVLVDELDALQIAYFGRTERNEAPEWRDQWQGIDALPDLVRIRVRPAGSRDWPELVAAPLTGANTFENEAARLNAEEHESQSTGGTGEETPFQQSD